MLIPKNWDEETNMKVLTKNCGTGHIRIDSSNQICKVMRFTELHLKEDGAKGDKPSFAFVLSNPSMKAVGEISEELMTKAFDELGYALKTNRWLKEAMEVMSPMQAIGKQMGIRIGESIHDKILPYIAQLQKELELLQDDERLRGIQQCEHVWESYKREGREDYGKRCIKCKVIE